MTADAGGTVERDRTVHGPRRRAAVQVLHDDVWVDGYVTAQRRDPDGWWALARYSAGVGMQYRHWRPASELRRP